MADVTQTLAGTITFPVESVPISITLDETALAAVIKAALGTASITGPAVVDNAGNIWGINASAQITLNGVVDTTTSNVATLAYLPPTAGAAPIIYQVNTKGQVYSKTAPTASWVATTWPTVVT